MEASYNLIDIGFKLKNITEAFYSGSISKMVLRALEVPTIDCKITMPKKIYVYASCLESYKEADNFKERASTIYPIGGAEWVNDFGDADEYANLLTSPYYNNYVEFYN